MPAPDDEQGRVEYRIAIRFGNDLLQAGFTAVPNILLNHYNELGISSAEFLFIVHLCQYWWTEKNPYPSLQAIADKMGTSQRQTRRYAESLKAAQLLEVHERIAPGRGQITSEYDLSKLFARLLELVPPGSVPRNDGDQTARTEMTGGGRTNLTGAPRTPMSAEEYTVQSDEVSSNNQPTQLGFSQNGSPSKFRKGSHPNFFEGNNEKEAAAVPLPTPQEKPAAALESPPATPTSRGMAHIAEVLREKQVPGAPPLTGLSDSGTAGVPDYRPPAVSAPETLRPDRRQRVEHDEDGISEPSNLETPTSKTLVRLAAARPGGRRTSRATAEERQSIQAYIGDFAPELGDQAPFKSSVTRVCNIYADSGMTMAAFSARMVSARSRTKDAVSRSAIKDRKKTFAYFCALLEEECGLREPPPEIAEAAKAPRKPTAKSATARGERKSLAGPYEHLIHR